MIQSTLESHLHDLAVDGFTILHDAIDPDFRMRLLKQIRELEDETLPPLEEGQTEDDCSFYRTGGLIESDPLFWDIPIHRELLPVVEGLLGPDFLLSQVSAIDVKPNTENLQPLHPDDALIPLVRPHAVPIGCTAMWCITDFRRETGGTRILPGSQKLESIGTDWSADTADDLPGVIQPEVKAGGILLFDHATFHGASSNHSDEWRLGIQCSYHAGWIRPYTNWFHAIPRADVARFPERLADLMGYKTFNGAIGTISDPGTNRFATSAFRSPRTALEEATR